MQYNEKPSTYSSHIIQDICRTFKDSQNPNNVDLVKLRQYAKKDKDLSDSHIFKRKLNWFSKYDTINRQDFQKHFYPNITNTDHFSLVFDELDRNHSGKISKRDLEFYNKETGLNLTKNDIEMMINIASRDGERVGKQDLYELLNVDNKCYY